MRSDTSLTISSQCTVWVLLSFGYLMDVLFASSSSFVFDPNPENWRRRVGEYWDGSSLFVSADSFLAPFFHTSPTDPQS